MRTNRIPQILIGLLFLFPATPVVSSMNASPIQQDDSMLRLRADARVVEIDVNVRDSHGKPVEDLKQSDFTVTDNGKPRPFTIFSVNRYSSTQSTHPTAAAETSDALPVRPALPPNVFTNIGTPQQRQPQTQQGHSTVILLDGMNGWFENFAWARLGVIGLMPKIPNDEKIALYVLQNGDGLALLQGF